jgi:hypothetical protein
MVANIHGGRLPVQGCAKKHQSWNEAIDPRKERKEKTVRTRTQIVPPSSKQVKKRIQ